jgi:hypothetical protein
MIKTFKDFHEMNLKEYLAQYFNNNLIIEGINIDIDNRIVSFNPSHERGVNTGLIINPTYDKVDDYDLISIFKRKKFKNNKYVKYDENPLVHALKGNNGWKIDKNDILKLMKQFVKICYKIKPKYDTIISIYSRSELNNEFLYRLNKIIKCDNEIYDMFRKIDKNEILENNIDFKGLTREEKSELLKCFDDMGKHFSFKTIPVKFRHRIKKIWNETLYGDELEVANKINGKNILILDDTIASGQTISTFCQNILKLYDPKNVTIITLFSKL